MHPCRSDERYRIFPFNVYDEIPALRNCDTPLRGVYSRAASVLPARIDKAIFSRSHVHTRTPCRKVSSSSFFFLFFFFPSYHFFFSLRRPWLIGLAWL